MKHPKKIPISCSLRFKPKPLGRNFGTPRNACYLVGGPWADTLLPTRTGLILPIAISGGVYLHDPVADRMTWRPA